MVIQHNLPAMNSHRQMGVNNNATSKNLEKLSSGYKINRAGDDAAGLAISEKMRSQIRGLSQATQNANNGISLIQTAEGALTETHDILQRMRELSVNSANATATDDDRKSIQKEVEALKSEVDRISTATHYNGIQLIDGSLSSKGTSGSSGAVSNTTKDLKNSYGIDVTKQTGGDITFGSNLSATVVDGGFTVKFELTDPADVNSIKATFIDGGGNEIKGGVTVNAAGGATSTVEFKTTDGTSVLKLDKVNVEQIAKDLQNKAGGTIEVYGTYAAKHTATVAAAATGSNVSASDISASGKGKNATYKYDGGDVSISGEAKISGQLTINFNGGDATSITATTDAGDTYKVSTNGNNLVLEDKDGNKSILAGLPGISAKTIGDPLSKTTGDDDISIVLNVDYKPEVKVGDTVKEEFKFNTDKTINGGGKTGSGLTFQIGANGSADQRVTLNVDDMSSKGLGINKIDLSTQDGANAAIAKLDAAIGKVSDTRADLGAMQNRLEHTVNNLGTTKENLQAAESTIRDVDMAKEMMEFTKNNILVQASQSMLAQSNQLPQGVLQLLR